MTDVEIIQLFFDRDESGIAELERQYGGRLLRAAERLLSREDAEECVNDTYLAVWQHVPPDRPRNLPAYAEKILKNNALNRLRSANALKRRVNLVELDDAISAVIPDPRANTEEEAILGTTDLLNSFLGRQPKVRRELFIQRYLYGRSIEELAECHGFTAAKVRKALYRMKEDLIAYVRRG